MASSYLVHLLTGEYILDHHSASQCDPMYDLGELTWARDWADEIAPGLELPRLLWPAEIAGTVTAGAAKETGLPVGIPVMAGTIDAWAEAVSVGVRKPGEVMLMYGTTMFITRTVDHPTPDERLWTTVGVLPQTLTLAGGMSTAGAVTDWFRNLTRENYSVLVKEAARTTAGADGLVILPYFAGERTPIFDPRARGAALGLTLKHGRGHIYRALLEATAFGVRHNLEVMDQRAGPPARVAAVGGGTQAQLWPQIVSDVCQIDQDQHQYQFGASYGDAYLAGLGAKVVSPSTVWNPVVSTIRPDPSTREVYDRMYDIYGKFYRATRGLAHRLADMQAASPSSAST